MQNDTNYAPNERQPRPRRPLPAPGDELSYTAEISSIRTRGNLLATATVTINGRINIAGVKIMEGANGLFVGMPSYKIAEGKYNYTVFALGDAEKQRFDAAVLFAFQAACRRRQFGADEFGSSVTLAM